MCCAGCVHSGVQYDHGAKWSPEENPCDVCYCLVGLMLTEVNITSFLSPSSALILFSPLTRRVTFAVRGSSVTPRVKTQLLLPPIPAVPFVKVSFFSSLCVGSVNRSDTVCVCAHVSCRLRCERS